MSNESGSETEPVIIKKYANRRLYNTDTSSYVTLDDLAEMVRLERDFVVYDAKSREDLTHAVLTQIIVEQESRGEQSLLPIRFMRQLIRLYGGDMDQMVPSYLEFSLDSLTREQERYSKQFTDAFGTVAFDAIQDQARNNLAMFEKAMGMFSPFPPQTAASEPDADEAEAPQPAESAAPNGDVAQASDEISALKAELSAMQQKLESLSRRSS